MSLFCRTRSYFMVTAFAAKGGMDAYIEQDFAEGSKNAKLSQKAAFLMENRSIFGVFSGVFGHFCQTQVNI